MPRVTVMRANPRKKKGATWSAFCRSNGCTFMREGLTKTEAGRAASSHINAYGHDAATVDMATAKANPLHGRPQTLAEYVRAGGRVFTVHDASGAPVGYVKAYARTSAARDARNAGLRLGKQVPVSHLATIATTLMQLNPATGTRVRVKANPPAARVAAVLSTRAVELRYLHAEDRRTPYKHAFSSGVTVQLLSDGSVRLFRPDGKPIWKKFED